MTATGTAHMWHQQVSWRPAGCQAVRTSGTVSRHAAGQAALDVLCTPRHVACSWRKAVGNNRATWLLTAWHVVCTLLQLLGAPLELPSRRTLWRSGCWTVTGQDPSVTLWQVGVSRCFVLHLTACGPARCDSLPNQHAYNSQRCSLGVHMLRMLAALGSTTGLCEDSSCRPTMLPPHTLLLRTYRPGLGCTERRQASGCVSVPGGASRLLVKANGGFHRPHDRHTRHPGCGRLRQQCKRQLRCGASTRANRHHRRSKQPAHQVWHHASRWAGPESTVCPPLLGSFEVMAVGWGCHRADSWIGVSEVV